VQVLHLKAQIDLCASTGGLPNVLELIFRYGPASSRHRRGQETFHSLLSHGGLQNLPRVGAERLDWSGGHARKPEAGHPGGEIRA
jgi:hypothetical protein